MSEYVKIDDTVRFGITTRTPSSGILTDADETPQWYVFEDGTDSVLLNGNFSQRAGIDGTYYSSFVASVANGFNAQSYYEIHVSGKVDNIIDRSIIKTFVVEDLITVSPTGTVNSHLVGSNAGVTVSITGSIGDIASAVWGAQINSYSNAGTFGSGLGALSNDIYYAAIKLVRDETNTQDEYSVCWFRNDFPLASSDISDPAISVYDVRTGSAVFENQTLTFASQKGVAYYDDTALRIASGEPYLVEASGLISSVTHNWKTIVGLDVY